MYCAVDWNRDGSFLGTYDDISDDVISARWAHGNRAPYQTMGNESTLTLTLDNSTGKYNPENSSSPIYGDLLPRRSVRFETAQAGATLFIGWIVRIRPSYQVAGAQSGKITATIECSGFKILMDEAYPNLGTYTNVTADVIIADILEQISVPPALQGVWLLGFTGLSELGISTFLTSSTSISSFLQTGKYVIPAYDVIGDKSAYEVITELVNTEYGKFYINHLGNAVFWNREFLQQRTKDNFFKGDTISTSLTYANQKVNAIGYQYADDLITVVRVRSNPRRTGTSDETLWNYDGEPITLGASQSTTIRAVLRKSDGQFASASSLTSTPTFISGSGTITVEEKGGVALVTITAGSNGCVLESLTLSGVSTQMLNQLQTSVQNYSNIALYGIQEQNIDYGVVSNYALLNDLANYTMIRRQTPAGFVSNAQWRFSGDELSKMQVFTNFAIGNTARVVVDELNHDRKYYICGCSGAWVSGDVWEYTVYLEPLPTELNTWQLGTNQLDIDAELGF